MPELRNPKWERFCQAYTHGETAANATRCYELVYGSENPDAARAAAARLRGHELIACRIAELLNEARLAELQATGRAAAALEITRESILARLLRVADANLLDYVTLDGNGKSVIDFAALRRDRAAALEQIVIEVGDPEGQGPRVRFKLGGRRHRALIDLGRHLGLFVKREDVTHHHEDLTDEQVTAQLVEIFDRLAALGVEIPPSRRGGGETVNIAAPDKTIPEC